MIATILPGSTNFHAVGYNEHKVSKGVARLIEIQNFGSLGTFVSIRPRACFFPLFSFLPLWLHYNLNPLCVQY